jgi:hypothetical protein
VTVTLNGTASTIAPGTQGVAAISLGGNGGSGGSAYVIGGSSGDGGAGGFGGNASAMLMSQGSITTSGIGSAGILAFSRGGNGGNGGGGGGLVYSAGGGSAAGKAADAFISIGEGASITTHEDFSHGAVARSIGGGGGSSSGGFGLFYSGGSNGSTGGNGGKATVWNDGSITTEGDYSLGIQAQSIGGGGGDAGSVAGAFSFGGDGAAGGNGGAVEVKAGATGSVSTSGQGSVAILAQSIGGTGGNGSNAGGLLALGGNGSLTTKGGTVTITNEGTIETEKSYAAGILAQSIGGGGGNGGTAGGWFTAGGDGGSGADGGSVTVKNSGNITTGMDGSLSSALSNSPGILAQSIGGGGGNGGGSISVGVGLSAAFGGSGGAGGSGGSVSVERNNSDDNLATPYFIHTYGDYSSAVAAQSIGGGGGNGGFAVSGSIGSVFSASIGYGGQGGSAGRGGGVLVETKGALATEGDNASGIFAQSIGGGGGNGGFAVSGSAAIAGITVDVGGGGGAGGSSSSVQVSSLSDISTSGASSFGILAQSIGGGGGNGGFTAGVSIGALGVSVGLGGYGGEGGDSGNVSVESSGTMLTLGDNATGILAQSIGGGGGNGGFSAVGSLGIFGAVTVGIGGDGSEGGYSGNVSVTSDGGDNTLIVDGYGDDWTLVTLGDNSTGILAQSIGGGGGNGGFSGTIALGGGGSAGVTLGGDGSGGSFAGTVEVTSHNSIFVAGDYSNGILAQSIGGGGGNGGFAVSLSGSLQSVGSAAVAVGGDGGSGGYGSSVHVTSEGGIITSGNMSSAIVAQSIGGGGGNGGFSAALTVTGGSFGGAVAVGGSGSYGARAGSVSVSSSGNIETFGQQSAGIVAQSIGGGGGNGGFAGSGSLSMSGISAAVGIGGSGGSGGYGSSAHVASDGDIVTHGDQSSSIIAQSIGGGGGNGGSTIGLSLGSSGAASVNIGGSAGSGGYSSSVTVSSSGNLSTGKTHASGNNAYGILAQSIGGGGGNGGFSGNITFGGLAGLGVSVGGSGGTGGNAGSVVVNGYGNISTLFDNSSAILAQSIGGGGGNGGFSFSAAGSASFEGIGAAGAVSIGGSGGAAGNAADVNVTNTGRISTAGFQSNGIEAQSIGGGGGNGGFSVSGAFTLGAVGIGVSVGGSGNGGGEAGEVTVTSYGMGYDGFPVLWSAPYGFLTLLTLGDQSNGVLAQSIGGGGGNGGFSGAGGFAMQGAAGGVSVGGFGGGGGHGDAVTVTSYNNILTFGDQSNGILAQSVGGRGGNGGFSIGLSGGSEFAGSVSVGGFGDSGGDAGAVSVRNYGSIWTNGADANGIEAQSIGGAGGNGGFSVAGDFSAGSAGIGLSVGGFGEEGGNAGEVSISSYARAINGIPVTIAPFLGLVTIGTAGDRSNGILAQSIGGGGGNGGFSGGLSVSASGGAFTASVGGFGKGGGDGKAVSVTSVNNIMTSGSDSNGILAQSLGGGGGNGGFSIGLSGGSKFAGSVSVGGFALGGGGSADAVTVNNVGTITTFGDRSSGIEAQSVGGAGGNGGFSLSGSFALGNAGLSASVGGFGSGGGIGGDVIVTSRNAIDHGLAAIETFGESSYGIQAQSIGGGGGNGGFSGAFTATADAKASVSLSVGGFGAAGNIAGNVSVDSRDNILTHSDGSNGILAQSIGGGGGSGGFSFAGTIAVPDGKSFNMSASLGGFGGSGGDAGIVGVSSVGRITTNGNNAPALAAQSIGGGGGNGGLSVAGTFNFASESQGNIPSITVSMGGFGGSGGAGNDVEINRNGDTATLGDDSSGILAQSIGGGGGNGGLSVAGSIGGKDAKQVSASVGGFGGDGSSAGHVAVSNHGNILTGSATMQEMQIAALGTVVEEVKVVTGRNSNGILAQSIGGGGGNGGFSFSGAIGTYGQDETNLNIGLTVGGFGGGGGTGGEVDVSNEGLVRTFGASANGILAQSIGGGGGNGGSAVTGLLSVGDPQSGGKAVNVAVSVGGWGGDGNTSGKVTVEQKGGIVTDGPGSNGILAQSIGGGGGNGGGANSLSLQLGTSCTFNPLGIMEKLNITSCQSPKNPSVNVQVDVGGFGGTGGNASAVDVTNEGFIITSGDASAGILAQSIGGGGGNGGQAIVGLDGLFPGAAYVDKALLVATLPISTTGFAKGLGKITVGGSGGAAGDGSDVKVTNKGFIQTSGSDAYALFAQSIGGGGGIGGNASSGITGLVSIGGFGGASGNGGDVSIISQSSENAAIKTFGSGSTGIFAQSIGGGGGNGGSAGGALSMGGFGGSSGNGGKVTVDNQVSIETMKENASAILAQSVGGGGGNGGSTGLSLLTLGGFGGASGNGGDVMVSNAEGTELITHSHAAYGIFAQSVGGGGGNGGGTGMGVITVGGFGGSGGNGGAVTIINNGAISTLGDDATGLFAQSIGGGGGNGGNTGLSLISVGGYADHDGSSRGNGGTVLVTNSGTAEILTYGDKSYGIHAQSIGGGGGNGGGTGKGGITVGGRGGASGDGGAVTINNDGTIRTFGNDASGLLAQSIGGGGGNGGKTDLSAVAVGGNGSGGGKGGDVAIVNTGIIVTDGIGSDAIRAQSVGGGGGSAGGASDPSEIIGLLVSVGGKGASGGNGGHVSVDNNNMLLTAEESSNGIFAQSIGGGGGFSGSAIGMIAVGGSEGSQGDGGNITIFNRENGTIWTKGEMSNGILAQSIGGGGGEGGGFCSGELLSFSALVGGYGSAGGNGGKVTVDNYGIIQADGTASQAILAQSIGGGGGNGKLAGSYADGSANDLATVIVGGNGCSGGNGGNVTVTNYLSGNITINGANSTAIFAQSIGGGGGNGGGVIHGSAQTGTAAIQLGGKGGDGGDGGAVSVVNNGSIQINASNSVGIMAQSVGGGGGTAGSAAGAELVPVSIGGQDGAEGKGGDVNVTNTGSIMINGDNSIGIFAQSVGGGGGLVEPGGGATSIELLSGGIGNGGIVTIDNSAGSIIVTGDNSIALYSQSVGGGGGAVGLASDPPGQTGAFLFSGSALGTGLAKQTVINQTGNLFALGNNSIALTAQSEAPDGNGNITVNILNDGQKQSIIAGGSDQGAGVMILSGAENHLNNDGIITSVLGVDGFAIRATSGNDNIHNNGWINGSVDLGAGANAFDNAVKALFESGETICLGEGNILSNEGLLSAGAYGRVLTSDLTGNFRQSATGVFGADLDLKNRITDRLNVTGTGDISGTIAINIVDPAVAPGYATPGLHRTVLIYTAGALEYNDITLSAPVTAVAHYSLEYIDDPEIDLNYVIDYAPDGLTENQNALGSAVNQIQSAQISPDFRPVATLLFYQPDIPALGNAYDVLSGEGLSAFLQTSFYADDMFLKSVANRTGSWVMHGMPYADGQNIIASIASGRAPNSSRNDLRAWVSGRAGKGELTGDQGIGSAAIDYSGGVVASGVDKQLSQAAMIGMATGFGRFSLNVPNLLTDGNTDIWHIAGYGAVRQGNLYLRGTLAYNKFDNEETRVVLIPGVRFEAPDGNKIDISGLEERLKGNFSGSSWSGDFEIGYRQEIGMFDVTPFAGIQFDSLTMHGFTEKGRNGENSSAGLTVHECSGNSLPFRLGMQLATKKEFSKDRSLAVSLRAAWVRELNTDRTISSSLTAAPGFDFLVHGAEPHEDALLASIGFDLGLGKNSAIYCSFEYGRSGEVDGYSGMLGLQMTW